MHEETLQTREIFSGRILRLEVLDVRLHDGRESIREIVRHPGAIAVLVRHIDGSLLFVRQFRKPVEEPVLELVAGTLEAGESPDECARRELREETGYEADSMEPLGDLYLTPGYSSERIHLYRAVVSGTPNPSTLDDDEVVETQRLSQEEFEAGIRSGQILDAKTLAAWTRDRLAGKQVS